MSKDLSRFVKIGVTKAVLNLSGKAPCFKELLNRCFIVENTSLETALMKLAKISSYPSDFLDFKEENALCNSSSAISFYFQNRSLIF